MLDLIGEMTYGPNDLDPAHFDRETTMARATCGECGAYSEGGRWWYLHSNHGAALEMAMSVRHAPNCSNIGRWA